MRGQYRPRDRSLHPRFALAGHAGHLPYLYVESVDETLTKVTANGGTIIRPPFREATWRSQQSTIPPGTCLASGSGDRATDDVIPWRA
jgi:hypothetical protein